MIERHLSGIVRLVRSWKRIGVKGLGLVAIHANQVAAGQALQAAARVERLRGYWALRGYAEQ